MDMAVRGRIGAISISQGPGGGGAGLAIDPNSRSTRIHDGAAKSPELRDLPLRFHWITACTAAGLRESLNSNDWFDSKKLRKIYQKRASIAINSSTCSVRDPEADAVPLEQRERRMVQPIFRFPEGQGGGFGGGRTAPSPSAKRIPSWGGRRSESVPVRLCLPVGVSSAPRTRVDEGRENGGALRPPRPSVRMVSF